MKIRTKLLKRMTVIALFACTSLQYASAQITLNVHNSSLKTVIEKIEKQAECRFFYDDDVEKVVVKKADVKNVSLAKALDAVLRGTGIAYTLNDNIVYLKKKETGIKASAPKNADVPQKKITGKILDEHGEPIIGATVAVKGSTEKAVTDIDGNYTIMADNDKPVLQFSYLGYKTKEVSVKNQNVVNTSMDVDTKSLNEVVVTALGIKREKKMLGYAVQDIKSDALNTTGDASVTGALDGKVAGLQMNMASTGLGGSTKITIRGNSSLTDNNQPLWIVDGVPFSDNQASSASAYGGYDRGGTSFDINPED
ncbi:MAG TPA: carboxypeptidase-like regulatory domain-containing protein, partial [Prevotella sp.]